MYACVHVCMCARVLVCYVLCVYVCMYVCMCMCECKSVCICVRGFMCAMRVCMHVYIYNVK